MELYTLDSSLRRERVVEGYESLIWTERYSAWGDFEIKTPSTPAVKALLKAKTYLALSESKRVMQVETVQDYYTDDNQKMLDIKGRSLEAALSDRVAMPAIANLATTPKWTITNTPANIVRTLFSTICVTAALNAGDTIPFYHSGTITPAGNIPESTDTVTVNLDPDTLYNSIKKVCDVYKLGFRLVRNGETSQLYFEVYNGSDRTTSQTAYPAVIFNRELDNLAKTSVLSSTAQAKTVAYVFAQNGTAVVYSVGADTTATGFDRRVLLVNASDIDTAAGLTLDNQLAQRGLEELSKYQNIYQFDGEISQYGSYTYGSDYNLGDLVEEQDPSGFGNRMRVVEQIFVSDPEGDRSYPTLSIDITLVPNTWSTWPPTDTWGIVPDADVWGNV